MTKEQITYKRGYLRFNNPDAPSVTQFNCKLGKAEARKFLSKLRVVVENYSSVVRSNRGAVNGSSLDIENMLDNGFESIPCGSEQLVVGKILDEGIEVTVIHYIRDGKSFKQMYLSPSIHKRISNGEYIGEVLESL